ncbi:MAG TPA: hypothetical protein VH186_03490 [Chloroflexia bacterium]|nr:hypothetical protein [Chloroflexia bacterium]
MQSSNNKVSATKPEPFQSHFLIADLLTLAPLLPGAGSSQVLKITPPRETVSDPAHLEAFFVTLVSLLSRTSGNGQLAGARINGGTNSRRYDKNKMARQVFLNGLENSLDKQKKALSETTRFDPENLEIRAKFKGIAKRYRPEWQHVVSFEIAGRYQEVCFLLRLADPTMLSPIVGLLRQEYPHLAIEPLNIDLPTAFQANYSLTTTLVASSGQHCTKYEANYGKGSLQKWRAFDPLVMADDTTRQLSACRWLMLSEHPTMPLTLSGSATSRKSNAADPKATPLRRLLTALAELEPGEIACSQLLVFGSVSKEWIKYQEAQALRLQERQISSYRVSASWTPGGQHRNIPGNAHSPISSSSDSRGLLSATVLATLLCAGYLSWLDFQQLLESGDTTQILLWLSLRLILLLGVLAILLVIWWVVCSGANGGRRKGEIFSMQPLEEKFSSPLVLAALRQVVSLNREPYLERVCCDPFFKPRFKEQGFSQIQAAKLYKVRQNWLQYVPSGISNSHFTVGNKQKLGEINTPQNQALWKFVQDIAQVLVEERLDALQENVAAGYSPFGSASANAFVTVPGESVPAQSYSSLLPYDWPSPPHLHSPGIDSLWPFNTPLFDWLNNLFDRHLPDAAREHRGLQVLNSLELSYLWHLPGGYETLDFVDRTGPKTMSPPPHLIQSSREMVRSNNFWDDYQAESGASAVNPLYCLNVEDTDEYED